ncbi:MAG: hypothetical protein ABJB66_16225 [Gemmatimonadaceae bacterium]
MSANGVPETTGRPVQSEPPAPQGDGAAGGVITTAMDLARFDIALTNGRLISDVGRNVMWPALKRPVEQCSRTDLGGFWVITTDIG